MLIDGSFRLAAGVVRAYCGVSIDGGARTPTCDDGAAIPAAYAATAVSITDCLPSVRATTLSCRRCHLRICAFVYGCVFLLAILQPIVVQTRYRCNQMIDTRLYHHLEVDHFLRATMALLGHSQ